MMFLHRDVSWSDNRKRQRAHNHPSTHTHDRHPSLFWLCCTQAHTQQLLESLRSPDWVLRTPRV